MADPLPPMGVLEDGWHRYPIRVYYEDTDAGGIVYHSRYLHFAERARSEMLRLLGVDHPKILCDEGIAFAVRHCDIDYQAPARLDDALMVMSRLTQVRGASLKAEQTVYGNGRVLAALRLRLGCIDRLGRPARLPADVRARLAAAVEPDRA